MSFSFSCLHVLAVLRLFLYSFPKLLANIYFIQSCPFLSAPLASQFKYDLEIIGGFSLNLNRWWVHWSSQQGMLNLPWQPKIYSYYIIYLHYKINLQSMHMLIQVSTCQAEKAPWIAMWWRLPACVMHEDRRILYILWKHTFAVKVLSSGWRVFNK